MAKFLIIRFSSIGDIVLTSPVIRCLKQQVPDAEVHFLTRDSFRPVLKHNPYIDRLHLLAHSWELLLDELKSEKYDYVIDLHRNSKSRKVKKALGVPAFTVNKLNIRKYLLTAFKVNLLPDLHIVDRYLKTVEQFSVKNDGRGLDYFISPEEEIQRKDIPGSHYAGYIACVIGAAHGTKRWPMHKWKSFCSEMKHPIILLGGKEDASRAAEIAASDPDRIYNACGKFSLNESADLVRKARLVISHDTGLMHIAAAFQKPIISLWGNTVPAFGMVPYYGQTGKADLRYEVKKLWCRPCSKIGYAKCPLGHFKCMEKIGVSDLLAGTQTVLQSGSSGR